MLEMFFKNLIQPNSKNYAIIFTLLSLSYLLNLKNVQFTGEEGVYTIMSYEMWFHNNWMMATHYGEPYWRPPFFNWLIIGFSHLFGWEHSLAGARLISGLSSVLSGVALYYFVNRVYRDKDRAWITAITYLASWQVLANYGWLAYSDAIFSLFCSLAMLLGLLAIHEEKIRWMIAACIAAFIAMLIKAITGFVFYGVTVLVAMVIFKKWRFVFSYKNIILHLSALLAIGAWHYFVPGGSSTGSGMVDDITQKFSGQSGIDYLVHLTTFPLITGLNLLPVSGFVVWLYFKNRASLLGQLDPILKIVFFAALINFLPYWLSPQGHNRYVLPLYGFFALALVGVMYRIYNSSKVAATSFKKCQSHFLKLVIGLLIIKVLAAIWLFPLYTNKARPNVELIAEEVLEISESKKQPLYASDGAWLGIAVASTIDVKIFPKPPLLIPPSDLKDGFVLHHANDPEVGQLYKSYKDKTFLLCRGTACN